MFLYHTVVERCPTWFSQPSTDTNESWWLMNTYYVSVPMLVDSLLSYPHTPRMHGCYHSHFIGEENKAQRGGVSALNPPTADGCFSFRVLATKRGVINIRCQLIWPPPCDPELRLMEEGATIFSCHFLCDIKLVSANSHLLNFSYFPLMIHSPRTFTVRFSRNYDIVFL